MAVRRRSKRVRYSEMQSVGRAKKYAAHAGLALWD